VTRSPCQHSRRSRAFLQAGAVALLTLVTLLLGADGVQGQRPGATGSIRGLLTEAEGGRPVSGALVRLQELGRTELSHGDGSFHFEQLRVGSYTVVVERIGYAVARVPVEIVSGRSTEVRIPLFPSAISVQGIVVTGVGRVRGVDETYRPSSALYGAELERSLSSSLASTLEREPGIAVRSFGPAPAQPVVRGMSGDRVVILEDGQRAGDMSATSADHAVGIDPLGAERIEVVRGPAGLLYGSNALGGVINVIRGEVPHTLPDRVTGSAGTQMESVNRGFTAGAHATVPVSGRFAVRAEASARTSGDVRTPLGMLDDSDVQASGGALGASWIPEWGYVGLSLRQYGLEHGVPGQFQGQLIPGAHPGGVEAHTTRRALRLELGHLGGLGPFSAVEAQAGLVHYVHDEVEARIPQPGGGTRALVGTSFDQLTVSGRLSASHRHEAGSLRTEGAVGVSGSWKDLLAGGRFPGLRSATESTVAVFGFEELQRGSLSLQAGLRFDWTAVEPASTRPVQTGAAPRPVGNRTFGDASGSLSSLWEPTPGWIVGASVSRAFRTPSIRELFSDGPHLADFTFDIGNPDLRSETGWGTDLFLRVVRTSLRAEVSAFRNALRNFIYHAPTGSLDPRFNRFPVFEARGTDALFEGVDGRIQWEFASSVVMDGTLSWVRAARRGDGDPLPAIPPLHGGVELRWESPRLFIEGGVEAQARQDRVPAAIPDPSDPGRLLLLERPTPGSTLLSAAVGTTWRMGGGDHSVVLQFRNLGDRVRRDHLSRVKDVAPEPGRNAQLLYRIRF
jgi:iron complex outermembrane recepter protein